MPEPYSPYDSNISSNSLNSNFSAFTNGFTTTTTTTTTTTDRKAMAKATLTKKVRFHDQIDVNDDHRSMRVIAF